VAPPRLFGETDLCGVAQVAIDPIVRELQQVLGCCVHQMVPFFNLGVR
jgi:hypothetical protein